MFKNMFMAAAVSAALMSTAALAQEDYARMRNEGSVQAVGSFLKSTMEDGVRQDSTNTGGILATYRYYFDRHNGVEVNYGWTNGTEKYDNFGVPTNSHEISAAYIFRIPLKHWAPFVLAGAGGLIFDPRDLNSVSSQARAEFSYGGGADINLTDHFFIRAQYRGIVYESPTYDLANLDGKDRITHRATPAIGFGWRF